MKLGQPHTLVNTATSFSQLYKLFRLRLSEVGCVGVAVLSLVARACTTYIKKTTIETTRRALRSPIIGVPTAGRLVNGYGGTAGCKELMRA